MRHGLPLTAGRADSFLGGFPGMVKSGHSNAFSGCNPSQKPRKGQSLFPASQRLGAFIGGFAPGTSASRFEPGSAILIRAGSTIVLQTHYTPNGKEAIDRTKIGFFFAKQPPERELRLATLINGQLKIPAGEKDHTIAAEMTTTADVTLRSLRPHTHLRGKSWEYTATYHDGRSEIVLAAAIKEEVLTRRMPQWNAARGFGAFANDPSLSPFEIALVAAWVDGGAPELLSPSEARSRRRPG